MRGGARSENVCAAAVCLPNGINRSLFCCTGGRGKSEMEKERERERQRCPVRRSRGSIIRMWSRYRLSILPFARLNIRSIDPFSRVSVTAPTPFAPRLDHSLSLSLFRPFFVRLPPTAIPYSRLDFLLIYSPSLSPPSLLFLPPQPHAVNGRYRERQP